MYLSFYSEEPPQRASMSNSGTLDRRHVSVDKQSENLVPRVPKIIASLCLAHALLVLGPSIALASSSSTRIGIHKMVLEFWTLFVSGLSALLAVTQCLPQLRLTSRLKHTGSLSIPTMGVQIPLSTALAVSLASTVDKVLDLDTVAIVSFAGCLVWVNHALTACFPSVLLAMCSYFNYVQPRLKHNDYGLQQEHGTTTPPDEMTPLMEGEDTDESQLTYTINKTISGCR